ncbi:MAG: YHYH domain-containing protein [Clostridia bacterium]|nr:YHYH domain-containing protein [Clostridia bacterium]
MKTTFIFRKYISFLFVLLGIFLLTPPANAHAGKTDASGGHYDQDSGTYHYHHGYPAHQHIGGQCPYDFDDKTGQSSGSPSTATKETTTFTPTPIAPPSSVETLPDDEAFLDSETSQISESALATRPSSPGGYSGNSGSGGGYSGSHFSPSRTGSDDFSEAFTWLFILAIVIGVIAMIASSVKNQAEAEERRAREQAQIAQAEKARMEKQKALREEQERRQREAAARAEREQEEKIRELHNAYDGKHILHFVDIPKGSEMNLDGLPREIGAASEWGDKYTFYVTKDGTSFHTKSCYYARYGRATHALRVGTDRHPCKLCGATLPPLEWAIEYRRIQSLAAAYDLNVDFTPPPTWYPPFVIRADRTVLSKGFITSLDPARVKRATEEIFTITEHSDGRSADVSPKDKMDSYTTTLTRCACPDNSIRHATCKHMIALAIHRGLLEIKQSKL